LVTAHARPSGFDRMRKDYLSRPAAPRALVFRMFAALLAFGLAAVPAVLALLEERPGGGRLLELVGLMVLGIAVPAFLFAPRGTPWRVWTGVVGLAATGVALLGRGLG
jgi:hypothetical protein